MTKTWANGFGVWHVAVPRSAGGVSERLQVAIDSLRSEIQPRERHADPTVWEFPTRVPELDTDDFVIYRESLPREEGS